MSSRNFRKIYGSNTLPPLDSDNSDGEYEPPINRPLKRFTYEGLELSSTGESDAAAVSEETGEDEVNADVPPPSEQRKKKNNNKKKRKKRFNSGPGTSGKHGEELDEIDRSLMEVNALLGSPEPVPVKPVKIDESRGLLVIDAKCLNVANEIRKLFGPDEPEEVRRRNKTQPHRNRLLRRVVVRPTNDTTIYDFKKQGLSMSIDRRDNDTIEFVYDHDLDHQKRHHAFLIRFATNLNRQGMELIHMGEAIQFMHVEPLMEIADTLFRLEEYRMANEIIENVMTYLQFVAHPSFNLRSRDVRLYYHYLENRPFHVVMLKYMYLLTNKACHRTALEIAKMLLNIDPSDPLAILFVIDTLALRAREHQWLIDAVEYFNEKRQAKMLINMQYSYALAHFHVAKKKKESFDTANKFLQDAILAYPEVVIKILQFTNVKEPKIQTHVMYTNALSGNENVRELIMIYAKMSAARWREPPVMEWFLRNAIELSQKYDNSQEIKDRVKEMAAMRINVFQVWPTEIVRHIAAIRYMTPLLLDTVLSPPGRVTSAWDPILDHGQNRYSYRTTRETPRALLYEFFTSMIPNIDPPVDD